MHDHEQFKNRFGTKEPEESYIIAAYNRFILSIREKYPKANIICTLGSMDATKEGSPWPGYVQKVVDQQHDSKMYTCFFKFKNANGHPTVAEQQSMADTLINFINRNIKW